MKKLIILLVLVIVLLSGCGAKRSYKSLIVNSVTLVGEQNWRIELGDEHVRDAKVYIYFEYQPNLQAGDRVELVKIEEE